MAELETLVACAADGSMAAAAAGLGVSRPAVAKRIRKLEDLAGLPLLERSGRGVTLTSEGAALLANARRILDERDLLMETVSKLRSQEGAVADGLKRLLGYSSAVIRAAQQPEARLAEASRLLEIVLDASRTGLVISDPDTGAVHLVNRAFCEITGRTREELQGRAAWDFAPWDDAGDRAGIIERLRATGLPAGARVGVRRPDGSLRPADTTARFVTLSGRREVLWSVDDLG